MELTDLHIRGLFAAAKSKELIKRSWLLDAMTVMNEYAHNIELAGVVGVGKVFSAEAALFDLGLGQVVCINKKFLGIVIDDAGMLYRIAVLSEVGTPIYHRLDTFKFTFDMASRYLGDNVFTRSNVTGDTTVGRFLENVIVLQYPTDYSVYQYDNSVWKVKRLLCSENGKDLQFCDRITRHRTRPRLNASV